MLAILGLLLLGAFPEVLGGRETFVHRDFLGQTYPAAHYLRLSLAAGEIPLWNPYNAAGIPFLAQWATGVLYPPMWLSLAIPEPWSLGLLCLAHVPLAGLGMYLLARAWTDSQLAAAAAGLSWAFAGVVQGSLHLPASMAALGWAPWVLWLVERAWRGGGLALPCAAAVSALQMLGGLPEFVLLTWVLAGLLALGAVVGEGLPASRTLGRLALVAGLGAGLCAAQLLPFLELLAASHRGTGFGSQSDPWSLAPAALPTLLVPHFGALRSLHGVYFVPGQELFASCYGGIAALGLALCALLRIRHWRVWVLGGAVALGLLLAMGEHAGLYGALRRVFPALGASRYPIKLVILASLALPPLAALALAAYVRGERRAGRGELAVLLALLAGIAACIAWARAWPTPPEPWTTTAASGALRSALLLAALGSLAVALHAGVPALARRAAACLAVLWLGVDLASLAPGQNPTVPVAAWGPEPPRMASPPALGEGRAMLSPAAYATFDRSGNPDLRLHLAGHRLALTGNLNLLGPIPVVGGHFWVYLRGDWDLRNRLYREGVLPAEGLVDFLAVTHISAADELFGWERRRGALPLATAGQQPRFADYPETLVAVTAPGFDPRSEVYLPPEARHEAARSGPAQVRLSRFQAHAVDLEVEAEAPAWVVVSQAFHRPWRARVDGTPTTLYRANGAYQALAVPPGEHRVTLRYEDGAFRLGAAVSGASLLGCAGLALAQRRRR